MKTTILFLLLCCSLAFGGTGTLSQRATGDTITASFFNDLTDALNGTLVGRNSSGVATSGQDLGSVTYPWGTYYGANANISTLATLPSGSISTSAWSYGASTFDGSGAATISNTVKSITTGMNFQAQSNSTDATTKNSRWVNGHYTNAEEPMCMLHGESTSSVNGVYIGGATSSCNAATTIQFYTAANNTTTSGTLRGSINTNGLWTIGTASTNSIHVLNGLLSATATSTDQIFSLTGNSGSVVRFLHQASSGEYNWQIGRWNAANSIGFTPSTAADGTSFNNDVLRLYRTGAIDLGNATLSSVTSVLGGVASTNSSTGTLVVTGGVGVSGAVNANGAISTNSTLFTGSTLTVGNNSTGDSNLGTIASVGLNKFYEGTFSLTFTGAFTSNQAVTVKYVKVGKMVTLTFPETTAACSVAGQITSTAAVPSGLDPNNTFWFRTLGLNNTVEIDTPVVRIQQGNVINILRDLAGTNYTASGTCGFRGFSVSYSTN